MQTAGCVFLCRLHTALVLLRLVLLAHQTSVDHITSFCALLQGVVTIQVNSLAPPPSSFRPLPAQLDTFEIERAFASGQGAVVGITDFVLQVRLQAVH